MTERRKSKYNTSEEIQKFEIALRHSEYAAEQLWQIFNIFILSHTILITLLGLIIVNHDTYDKFYLNLTLAVGILTSFLWLGAYFRTRGYFNFRTAQASQIEPEGLKLLRERGKNFAEGRVVEIEGVHFQMNCFARFLRMSWTMPGFIFLFIGFYIALLAHNNFLK